MTTNSDIYILNFSSLFLVKELGDCFHSFLKKEYSSEQWEFLVELDALLQLPTRERGKKVEFIRDEFVVADSPRELNISSELRRRCLHNIAYHKHENSFEEVKRSIFLQLKTDSFRRFVRTRECKQMIEKYHSDKNIVSPLISTFYNYTDVDFTIPKVDQADFDFFEMLASDSPFWELTHTATDSKQSYRVNTYWTTTNYLPNVSILKHISLVKYECIVPFSLETCASEYLPCAQQMKVDPNCAGFETLKYIEDPIAGNLALNVFDMRLPQPFSGRKYPCVSMMKYDAIAKKLIHVNKPCEFDKYKEVPWCGMCQDTNYYKMFDFQSTIFQVIDENRTQFTQIHIFDLCGWLKFPQLQKFITQYRGKALGSELTKFIMNREKIKTFTQMKNSQSFKIDGNAKLLFDLQINQKDWVERIVQEQMVLLFLAFNDTVFHFQ